MCADLPDTHEPAGTARPRDRDRLGEQRALARALPVDGVRPRRRARASTWSSSTTNRPTAPASWSSRSSRRRGSSARANRGFGYGNNRGLETTSRAVRAVPEPRHRDRRGDVRRARRAARRAPADRRGRGSPDHRRRHAVADDPPLSQPRPRAGRSAVLRALAGASRVGGGARARPGRRTSGRPSATGPPARSCSCAARRC